MISMQFDVFGVHFSDINFLGISIGSPSISLILCSTTYHNINIVNIIDINNIVNDNINPESGLVV